MWVLLTCIAVFLWSLVNISDNYLVEKNEKLGHPIGALVIFSSLFAFVVALAIVLFTGGSLLLAMNSTWILIIAGFCNLLWIVCYFYALADDDVSRVIPWFLTVPLFGYILGYLFLGETLTTTQLIGGAIILLGGLILSVRSDDTESSIRYHVRWKPILLMLLASFLTAVWVVLFKLVAKDTGFWVATFWEHIGLGIAGILVLLFVKSYRQGFTAMLQKSGRKILALNLFSETATIVGNLLANYAVLTVPVVLVLVIEVAQPLIVFLLGIVCTIFFPHILTEDISKRSLIHKGISLLIMIVGGILLG